jgi:hypothetical protein
MKRYWNIAAVACVMAILASVRCEGQERTILSVETDPSTFLFDGYSFHLRVKPAASEKFLIGAGTYGMDIPDPMVDLNTNNKDEGWNVRIKNAYGLFGEYYFKEANHRWFVGEQLSIQNYRVSNDLEQAAGAAKFRNLLMLTYLGYSWHPFKGSFYIKPWLGLGYSRQINGNTTVGAMKYDNAPLFGFFTFHIGYSF